MSEIEYQLVMRKGPNPGQIFPLVEATITIGRDPMSDIVLNDPEVSRYHSRLTQVESGYRIEDMGSTNGTFVDGQKTGDGGVLLEPGQVVVIGSTISLTYQIAGTGLDASKTAVAGPDVWANLSEPTLDAEMMNVASSPTAATASLPDPPPDPFAEPELGSQDIPPAPAMPDFMADEKPEPTYQPDPPHERVQSSYETTPANNPYVAPSDGSGNTNRRNLLIGIGIFALVICCCCAFLAFMWFYGGDWMLREMGLIP